MNSLLIVDGFYFLYRNFFGMPGRYNSKGMNTNALDGFSFSLQRAKREFKYTHTVVVLDSKEPTFRHLLCPDYKADRKVPEELEPQLDHIESMLDAMDVPYVKKSGFEGDDIIGSLATQFSKDGSRVTILTGDKDMTQLVDENITVEEIFNRKYYDQEGVLAKFGVYPQQMVDYLTLVGDSSDGIKGVNGIGPKTAVALLQEFGSLDNILSDPSKLNYKFVKIVSENIEAIKKDKILATIVTDIDLELEFDSIKSREINSEGIIEFKKQLML